MRPESLGSTERAIEGDHPAAYSRAGFDSGLPAGYNLKMKGEKKGISLNYMADYYDCTGLTEKSRFRRKQIERMDIREGERILDVGCGTGSLTLLAKMAAGPSGEVTGIDLAPKMIENARKKAARADLDIRFQEASVDDLPFPDGHFDLVISSMMFHHLPVNIKRKGLLEIHRVLKPQGRLFFSDFAAPHPLTFPLSLMMFLWISPTRFQFLGKLPGLIRDCGFETPALKNKGLFLTHYLIRKK